MTILRTVLACALSGAAGVVFTGWFIHGERASAGHFESAEPQIEVTTARPAEVQGDRRFTAMQARLAALEARALRDPTGTPADDSESEPSHESMTPEQHAEASNAQVQAHAESMATLHQQQPANADWNRTVTGQIAQFSQAGRAAFSHFEVDCRSSLCRVEMTHQTPDAARDFLSSARQAEGFSGAALLMRHEGETHGEVITELWLASPGQELPSLPQGEAEPL